MPPEAKPMAQTAMIEGKAATRGGVGAPGSGSDECASVTVEPVNPILQNK
jgi:hypothetical protein